jgi:hypothetical protein
MHSLVCRSVNADLPAFEKQCICAASHDKSG